ncbi:FAD-dependent 5-carboxymethylaminomethyl-2-thiouridine(34) oxidoreductase MnmC [Sphaerotilus microaerophilus]|uniref:tRNA 5-methylaminomethyl-2-thiouridine biosynthesis bifunctional protein MnmC n=1 Tax=Sphaerotilus microaerophilus TaxID=2914710 RepID=A0ABN6PMR1_9BURK|nr:FAD-dependent 5-carboxymethylaminomethyl-2-thiouridine(34) oxidoreductase MnmC [Sphaerotilus sp. FB-5]BDI05552.1 tRNA 5-methylaminomethyl-2-thiouridine biosynthesis bifunctional protein MnmC [Sphaerotilus sp. FB-5]
MLRSPITPARIEFDPQGIPTAPDFGDVYHSSEGALAQAWHVFLGGNGLPQRWAGRQRFVVLETGFGLGHNFLATWAAWRDDPRRSERLVYVAIEKHPATRADIARVHAASDGARELPGLTAQLVAAWPLATPDVHRLDFEDGRVQLHLALGDVNERLRGLQLEADAIYLDGFAPARNAAMWTPEVFMRLGRVAAPGATAATWSAARAVRDGLASAGFTVELRAGFGAKREMTVARFAPRFRTPAPVAFRPVSGEPPASAREALVIGAGLAGCAAAWALAQQGWRAQVIDAEPAPAGRTSGNPGGLMHPIFNAPDSLHARWFRAGGLRTAQLAGPPIARGEVAGRVDGFLRLETRLDRGRAEARLADVGLPDTFLRWLDAGEASARIGLPLPQGGWWFGQGGWLSPHDWCGWLLGEAQRLAGAAFLGGRRVARLARIDAAAGGRHWQALDEQGQPIADAPVVVLAQALDIPRLLAAGAHTATLAPTPLPLAAARGQTTVLPARAIERGAVRVPRAALAGAGYALALPDGRVLTGATTQLDDDDPTVRDGDHVENLQRAAALGLFGAERRDTAPADQLALPALLGQLGLTPGELDGRCGWRATTPDRLPLVGPLVDAAALERARAAGARLDAARQLPRGHDADGGLYVCTGLGSRGLTSAVLAAELLASWVTGAPCPVDSELRDALDPARFLLRSQRGGG